MRDINQIILFGRIGMDPVLRMSKNGIAYTTFNLATEYFIKSKNESETTWHRIVVWGKDAQKCVETAKKGTSIFIDGYTKVRKIENEEGVMTYLHEVHAEKINILRYKAKSLISEDQALAQPTLDH